MPEKKTVRINNRLYDAVTGLPVDANTTKKAETAKTKPAKQRTQSPATAVHAAPQRSQTLHRRATKKPGLPKRPQPGTHMDIARSSSVSRFAKHPTSASASVATPAKTIASADIAPKPHPVAKKAVAKIEKPKKPAKTAKQVKETAIDKALAPANTPKKEKVSKKERLKRLSWTRRKTIITAIMLFLVSAAAVTYFNLPTLSVAWASSQAGVDASYPKYVPDGYHLRQPVTYNEDEVVLSFGANAGNSQYSITQTQSSWDSSAVRDNVVRKTAGDNYITTQERGLTIYIYDDSAAWVSGGILTVISGDAPLSSDQLRRIAVSL